MKSHPKPATFHKTQWLAGAQVKPIKILHDQATVAQQWGLNLLLLLPESAALLFVIPIFLASLLIGAAIHLKATGQI